VFPIRRAPGGGRYLVDASGQPFLLQGDAAWSMIVQLNDADLEQYLSSRAAKGFNTLLVSIIEHHFSANPPQDVFGNAPFTTAGDFSTPNPAYFAHVDAVLERARAHGFLVLLTFAYLGFQGGNEGWYAELSAQSTATLQGYGSFLGARYKNQTNIIWVAGGDYNPPNKDIVRAIKDGIRSQDTGHLFTVHCAPEFGALQYWAGDSWVDLDNVYTYGDVAAASAAAYARSTAPFFLIESTYENEHGVSARTLRGQAYGALLAGAMGQVFGNAPIWCFGPSDCFNWVGALAWKGQLDSPGSRHQAVLGALFGGLPWPTLRPSTNLVTSGGTGTVSSVASDGKIALVYLPSGRTFSVNLSLMSGTTRGSWVDPVNGARTSAGAWAPSGAQTLTTPGTNNSGDGDWVLLLDAR
jgi:hypothetical protein